MELVKREEAKKIYDEFDTSIEYNYVVGLINEEILMKASNGELFVDFDIGSFSAKTKMIIIKDLQGAGYNVSSDERLNSHVTLNALGFPLQDMIRITW